MFTIPPLASVGLTEEQAKIKGLEFDVISGSTDGWYTSKRLKMKNTGFKVLVDKKSGMIQGPIFALRMQRKRSIFLHMQ